MLDIQGLSISFHKQPVLQHLSFHLDGHECIYIHGINGSGKSTLFKLICDIIKPTSGTITKKNDLQIGALIENPGFLENETLAYNLQFLASLKNQYDSTYIESLCQQFQLDLHSSMKLKNFSVGMRQKAGIIQAIMVNQELILLDEPTRGLDQTSIHTFCQLINQLHDKGHTIVIAAHDYLPDIHYTHIYRLEEGQLFLDEMD